MWGQVGRLFDTCQNLPHVSLGFMGFGLLQYWGCWNMNDVARNLSLVGDLFATPDYQDLYVLAQILTFVALGILARACSPYYRSGAALAIALFVATAGSLLSIAATILGPLPPALTATACAAMGLSYGYLFMLWIEVLGCLPGVLIIIAYLGSTVLYYLLATACHYVEPVVNAPVYALAPLASCLMLVASSRWLRECNLPHPMDGPVLPPWQIVLAVLLFSVVFDLSGGFVLYSTTNVLVRFGRLIPVMALLLLAVFYRRFDFSKLYVIIVAFMIFGLVVNLFIGGESPFEQAMVQAGAESFTLLVLVVACSYAYRLHVSAVALYAPLLSLNLVVRLIFSKLAGDASTPLDQPGALAVVCAAGIVVLVLILGRPSFVNRIEPMPAERKSLATWARQQADVFGFSDQECAILRLLAGGRTTAEIAEALFISPNTVRVHISSMYKKVGVHTRAELLEAMGPAPDSPAAAPH